MNLNTALGAGLNQGYSQSGQSSGSVNSAQSYNNSFNDSYSESHSMSGTDAETARAWSAWAADVAWERDMQAMLMQMGYNASEAEKQRQWQADMANTIYTRSVKNMREAGINPILAYRMGLSGASVGSGATASLGGVPSAPLAQNFMDSWSSSSAYSRGHGEGNGMSNSDGSSWGNGWSNSEYGIVTALQGLGDMADQALETINSGNALDMLNNFYGDKYLPEQLGKEISDKIKGAVGGVAEKIGKKLQDYTKEEKGGGHGF